MAKSEPMLRINYSKPEKPQCSVCGEEFDQDGSSLDMIAAFIFHVRQKHVHEDTGQAAARIVREATEN